MRNSTMKKVVCHNASTFAFGFLDSTRPWTSVDVSCAEDGHPVIHPNALVHPIQVVLTSPLLTEKIAKHLCKDLDANSNTF